MKKNLKTVSALVMMVIAFSATANGNVDITVTSHKVFELSISNPELETRLLLRNDKNEIIYDSSLSEKTSFRKKFDMTLCPEGSYRLELIDNTKSHVIPLQIINQKLDVLTKQGKTYFMPTLFQKGNEVRVNMLALNNESLSISVVDNNDKEIFNDRIANKNNLGRIYDFSKLKAGEYDVLLSSNKNFLRKTVTIK